MDFASWSPSHTILVLFIVGGFIGQLAILFYRTGRLEKRADSTDERIDKQGEMFFHALERLEDRMDKRFVEVISHMNQQIGEVRAEIGAVRTDMNQQIGEVRADMNQQIGEVRAEIAGVRTDLNQQIGDVRTEIAGVRTELSKLNQNHIDHLTHHN